MIMPRPKKDYKILNIKLDSNIYKELDIFCKSIGQTKTYAVEKAIKEYLKKYQDVKDIMNK